MRRFVSKFLMFFVILLMLLQPVRAEASQYFADDTYACLNATKKIEKEYQIKKHLLTNCIGTLIVTTTLQIPSSIFTESFLSFLGLGVNAPMPSLGSLASAALNGLQSYPYRLFAPAIMISVIILSFNLLGDGLRDAFDPKLKN